MSRHALGWLLLFAWPGVLSGLSLTGSWLLPMTATPREVLVFCSLACLGAAVGGYVMSIESRAAIVRLMSFVAAFLFGGGMYLAAVAAGDRLLGL